MHTMLKTMRTATVDAKLEKKLRASRRKKAVHNAPLVYLPFLLPHVFTHPRRRHAAHRRLHTSEAGPRPGIARGLCTGKCP